MKSDVAGLVQSQQKSAQMKKIARYLLTAKNSMLLSPSTSHSVPYYGKTRAEINLMGRMNSDTFLKVAYVGVVL